MLAPVSRAHHGTASRIGGKCLMSISLGAYHSPRDFLDEVDRGRLRFWCGMQNCECAADVRSGELSTRIAPSVTLTSTLHQSMLHQENQSVIINTGSKQGITNPPYVAPPLSPRSTPTIYLHHTYAQWKRCVQRIQSSGQKPHRRPRIRTARTAAQ